MKDYYLNEMSKKDFLLSGFNRNFDINEDENFNSPIRGREAKKLRKKKRQEAKQRKEERENE